MNDIFLNSQTNAKPCSLDRNAMRSFIHRMNWHDVHKSALLRNCCVFICSPTREDLLKNKKAIAALFMRMLSFNKKDKILRCLSKQGIKGIGSEKLASQLNIDHYIVYTLCSEMELRGHVKNMGTATASSEFYTYHTSILPAGKYFLDNGGYVWEWIKTAIIEFPKNFWWIIAIFSFWAGRDFTCNAKKESTQQVQQSQQNGHNK